jgi:hypothetical protein
VTDIKISDLPDASTLGGTELIPLVQSGVTAKVAVSSLPRTVSRVTTPTYSASLTLNWAVADVIRVTLTGNITITNSGAVDGQKCVLELLQDGTGSRTVAFTGETRYGTSIPSFTATTTASKLDRVGFIYTGVTSKYDVLAISKGF